MPDEDRTEQATPHKRQEARRLGQVARSPEITAASLFLAFVLTMPLGFPWLGEYLVAVMQGWLRAAGQLQGLTLPPLGTILGNALLPVLPVMGLATAVSLLVNLLQVGAVWSFKPLMPTLERINPVRGFQRLFSTYALFEFAKALMKFLLIGWVAWRTVQGELDHLLALGRMPLPQTMSVTGHLLYTLSLRIGFLWLVLALIDYAYQRWLYERSLRMSRQELKEEYRQIEGDPHVRARMRQRMMLLARRRMIQNVRKADVVITNPVTYAVALRYDSTQMRAPQLLAKGRGWLAERIRQEALRWHVPITPNPPLARSLYALVEVGEEIPPNLYEAVAQVLAFVYRLRRGQGYR